MARYSAFLLSIFLLALIIAINFAAAKSATQKIDEVITNAAAPVKETIVDAANKEEEKVAAQVSEEEKKNPEPNDEDDADAKQDDDDDEPVVERVVDEEADRKFVADALAGNKDDDENEEDVKQVEELKEIVKQSQAVGAQKPNKTSKYPDRKAGDIGKKVKESFVQMNELDEDAQALEVQSRLEEAKRKIEAVRARIPDMSILEGMEGKGFDGALHALKKYGAGGKVPDLESIKKHLSKLKAKRAAGEDVGAEDLMTIMTDANNEEQEKEAKKESEPIAQKPVEEKKVVEEDKVEKVEKVAKVDEEIVVDKTEVKDEL